MDQKWRNRGDRTGGEEGIEEIEQEGRKNGDRIGGEKRIEKIEHERRKEKRRWKIKGRKQARVQEFTQGDARL